MKRKLKKPMRYCLVRNCGIDSKTSPNKLFIRVPTNSQSKERWFRAIDVSPTRSRKSNCQFCCEDHFDNDAENFMEFKTIGSRLRIKKNVVPHLNLNIHEISEESQFPSSEKMIRKSNLERFKRFKEIGVGTTPPRKYAASKKNQKYTCYSSVSDYDSNSLASSEDLIERLQQSREIKDHSYSSTSSANLTKTQRFKDVGICTSPPRGIFEDEEEIENSVLFLNQLTNHDREMIIFVKEEKQDPLITPENDLKSVAEDINKKQLTTPDQEMNIIVEEEKEDPIMSPNGKSDPKSVTEDTNKINNNNKQLATQSQEMKIALVVEEKEEQSKEINIETITEVTKIKEELIDELELDNSRENEYSYDQLIAAPEFISIKEELIDHQYIKNEKENHKIIVNEPFDVSEFCQQTVKVEPELDSVQNNSASENKKFKCLMCSESFSDAISLKTHASAHIKSIEGVKCSICKINCTSNSDLKRHLKGHMNVLFLMQNLSKTF